MKKRILSILLTLAMALTLLPATASAQELPDWNFLFAIFKNVDAGGTDKDGKAMWAKHSMGQDEVDLIRKQAPMFEEYMSQVGVMRAHADVVEIDATVTALGESSYGAWLTAENAEPLLRNAVDLDRYDHVFCIVILNDLRTDYLGLTGGPFENGTGHSCVNLITREDCLNLAKPTAWPPSLYVHEFLHFVNLLSEKWGAKYDLHGIGDRFYAPIGDGDNGWKTCYTDIILNRVKGDAESGTGVPPAAWQYPPHVIRTMRELAVPSGVAGIGGWAFSKCVSLTKVTLPSSVASLEYAAFLDCTSLTEAVMSPGLTNIGDWAFGGCTALTKVTIPASVASIGECAFYNTGLTDVYYSGTEAQWNAIRISGYNETLTNAAIHYQSPVPTETQTPVQPKPSNFQDVPNNAYYAQPVSWAVEKGVTGGTSATTFSPGNTCTQAQILTFLWRANGSPSPAQAASGTEYYASALQWAKEQKIIVTDIVPSSPCTRADVVTYLWRLAGGPSASPSSFTDVAAGASYAPAVAWAVSKGITGGTTPTTFNPDAACTRGQIVTFLYRALA